MNNIEEQTYHLVATYCPTCGKQRTHIIRPEEVSIGECAVCLAVASMKLGYRTKKDNTILTKL